jgi:hypothetical protein
MFAVVSGGFYGWPRPVVGQTRINELIFLFTIGALGLTLLMQALCTVGRTARKGGACVIYSARRFAHDKQSLETFCD